LLEPPLPLLEPPLPLLEPPLPLLEPPLPSLLPPALPTAPLEPPDPVRPPALDPLPEPPEFGVPSAPGSVAASSQAASSQHPKASPRHCKRCPRPSLIMIVRSELGRSTMEFSNASTLMFAPQREVSRLLSAGS
jgi:hypothetical protein